MQKRTNDNPAGKDITLHFNVITNALDGKDQFKAVLVVTNKSTYTLNNNWSIYFNFLRMIVPESVSNGFKIQHVNGDYFSLEPTSGFTSLLPGEEVCIEFIGSFWAIKTIDAPAGFYIVYRDEALNELSPEVIRDPSVGAFTSPKQVKRSDKDIKPIPTASSRYNEAVKVPLLPKADLEPIMPTPVFYEKKEGTFYIKESSVIAFEPHLKDEAQFLASALSAFLGNGKSINIVEGYNGTIKLITAPVKIGPKPEDWNTEAYMLQVDEAGINLTGAGAAAIFYGIQSLLQLIENTYGNNVQLAIPYIVVKDKPLFCYRGLHLDVARNFHKPITIRKLMDMMSYYKLNKFHFHLTDDEGWRIEIPGLPELTEIGSRRGHTFTEVDCLLPSYGSRCDPNDLDSPGNGFYKRQEFIELLRYAHERHIEVIPEIDFPGHARAAIRAMEIRHDRYKAEGDVVKANEYLLTDWNDISEYESVQMWRRNVVNIGMASTYRFIEKIIDEMVLMYEEADVKLSMVHIGGDEVPHGAWLKSPVCIKLMEEHPELQDVYDLAEYFIKRINRILEKKGLRTAGWEEVALVHKNDKIELNTSLKDHQVIPYAWNTVWGDGGETIPYRLANLGYQMVLCNAPSLYFDLAYDKDPEEEGYYWGGYTDVIDTFKFQPFNFYKCAEENVLGEKIDYETQYKNAERLTEAGQKNILGIQGQLWGETIKSAERLEYLLFPRMCALAERAWAKQPHWVTFDDSNQRNKAIQKDWNQFANRLGQLELPRLDTKFGGVGYRVPLPGAKIENGRLKANSPLPGLTIRYTEDGSDPTQNSSIYKEEVQVAGNLVKLKLFTKNGRSSRSVQVKNIAQSLVPEKEIRMTKNI